MIHGLFKAFYYYYKNEQTWIELNYTNNKKNGIYKEL